MPAIRGIGSDNTNCIDISGVSQLSISGGTTRGIPTGDGTGNVSTTISSIAQTDYDNWLTANPGATIQDAEAWMLPQLQSPDGSFDTYVHVYTLTPLSFTVVITEPGATIVPDWWVIQ